MKILKPGKVPDKRKKIICKTCKCIFECDKYKYEYKCHYDLKEPTIDVCNKCKKKFNMPYDVCCLHECGEHYFCGGCNNGIYLKGDSDGS